MHGIHVLAFAVSVLSAAIVGAGCRGPLDDRRFAHLADDADVSRFAHNNAEQWSDEATERPSVRRGADDEKRSAASAQSAPQSLDELLDQALAEHPRLQAATARWEAARERIPQATQLPEPQLSYRFVINQIDTDQDPVGHTVGLSQPFPWFGTLEAAGDVAAAEARAAWQQYEREVLAVAAEIKQAYAEYAAITVSASILAEHVQLLEGLEPVVQRMYETGEVGQQDLLRIHSEIDTVENERTDFVQLREAAKARLNAAAGRAAIAPLPEPDVEELHRDQTEVDEAQLLDALHERNPELKEIQAQAEGSRRAMRLAEKAYGPDFSIGLEYGIGTDRRMARMDGGGSDMLAGMISVSLPIWRDAYEAGVREAMAELSGNLKRYTDRRNVLESDLQMALYRLRDAQRRTVLFGETLADRADQILRTTETAYRTGEATFTDLIEAQRELLDFELAHIRAVSDRFQSIAQIEAIVGTPMRDVEVQR